MTLRNVIAAIFGFATLAAAASTLEFYFIDAEGGQATLIVTPQKDSILVDAGWPGYDGRDADRIIAAAKKAGLKQIGYLVVTHYHGDHVGGVEQLAAKFPIGTFVDHGPNNETGASAEKLSASYNRAIGKSKHLVVKPGDKIPLKGAEVTVVEANGVSIASALPGAGQTNPLCASASRRGDDPSENARSTGFVLQFGKFRFVDLGDLTWNKELELVCPANKLGSIDLYLTTHHGMDISGPPALVHAIHPRVAIMNNGAKKGGTAPAWKIIKQSPGLEDLWQVHYALAGGKESNVDEKMIANMDEKCQGYGLSVSAQKNGAFKVTNERNKESKNYPAK